jgi:hypothetical protein
MMSSSLVKEGGDLGKQEYDGAHLGYLEAMEEIFDRYEHATVLDAIVLDAIVLDATHDDWAAIDVELAGFEVEMESVDLQRQLVLLARDVPAERQSDALRLGRHPFCDGAEGYMLDDTSPLEGANLRGSVPDAGDGLLVDELVSASTAARGGANRRGTQSRRAAAPCRAPGVPAVSRKDNVMSAGECLKRALDACRTLASLTSRTAVVHVPLSRHSAAALACQSRYCEAIDISVPAYIIVLVPHDPPPGVVSRAYGSSPAEALDRGSVFALTIRLRESDGNGLSANARDLLELVCSCDSIGEAE